MKKIILNGCSWVAGDEMLWNQFLHEMGQDPNDPTMQWNTSTHSLIFKSLQNEYRYVYREKHNQGGMLSRDLGTEVIDLAADGNSNDNIAMSTIGEILEIPAEHRQDYHVIIGWTVKERKLLFLEYMWENAHISHYSKQTGDWARWQQRLLGSVVEETDNDWYLNYFKNVFLLENFLKNQKMTYTFYRSLGSKDEFYNYSVNKNKDILKAILTPVDKANQSVPRRKVRLEALTPNAIDSTNWLAFFEEDKNLGMASNSWTHYMKEKFQPTWQWYISEHNRHPNSIATQKLVDIIKAHLLKHNLLN